MACSLSLSLFSLHPQSEAVDMMDQIVHWVREDPSGLGRPQLPGAVASESMAVPMMLLCLVEQLGEEDEELAGRYAQLGHWCARRILQHVQVGAGGRHRRQTGPGSWGAGQPPPPPGGRLPRSSWAPKAPFRHLEAWGGPARVRCGLGPSGRGGGLQGSLGGTEGPRVGVRAPDTARRRKPGPEPSWSQASVFQDSHSLVRDGRWVTGSLILKWPSPRAGATCTLGSRMGGAQD